MIIGFCGHSDVLLSNDERTIIKNIIIDLVSKNDKVEFYLGGYGNFDYACANILKELKSTYSKIERVFITPYANEKYIKNKFDKTLYDTCIFPALENVPKKLAIIRRNFWIVDKCDVLICYVSYNFGGARKTYDYAKNKGVSIYNLPNLLT